MSDKQDARLSRRSFLTGSALVAIGAAAGLAGCAPSGNSGSGSDSGSKAVSFDKEVDIIVVGSGTVAFAAGAAADFGAESVLILEKSENQFGGTSSFSGGGVGIPLTYVAEQQGIEDTEEAVLAYYKAASFGRADEAVVRSYIKNGNAFLEWSRDYFGFTWNLTTPAFQDYYEPCEGFLAYGRGNISVTEINGEPNTHAAGGTWNAIRAKLESSDKVELMMGTAATKLINDDTGRVIGVVANGPNGEMKIGAKKAVILGTGGFDHNDEMRKEYLPYPLFITNAVAGNTGDAQKMGLEIGAALAHMDRSWGLPCFIPTGDKYETLLAENRIVYDFIGNDWAMYRGKPGAIVVNKAGKRFGDEAQVYDVFNRDFGQFSSADATFPNIPAFFIADSSYASNYTFPGQKEGDPVPEWITQADTLEELADMLGIDPAGLLAEVAEFNANAKEGKDPHFGRGTKSIDINTSGLYAGSRTDIPNPCLSPLETGPFYGAVYVPGTCGTNGGLKTNENGNVVTFAGEPIPGLYAVGNCSSGVSGGAYCHGGMTLGSGGVMSYVAARHALGVA